MMFAIIDGMWADVGQSNRINVEEMAAALASPSVDLQCATVWQLGPNRVSTDGRMHVSC